MKTMKSENLAEMAKEYNSPQHQEHLKQMEKIKNDANEKIFSLRDENKKLKKEIVGLKQEKKD
jgi:hypothetical protein